MWGKLARSHMRRNKVKCFLCLIFVGLLLREAIVHSARSQPASVRADEGSQPASARTEEGSQPASARTEEGSQRVEEQASSQAVGILMWASPSYMVRGIPLSISVWQCYALQAKYRFFLEVHPFMQAGHHPISPFISKLLAVKKYLPHVKYLLVVDADTVVVNMSQRIETLVQHADLTFHERMHNSELAASVWAVQNTTFAMSFLDDWLTFALCNCANHKVQYHNHDNGALIHLIYRRYLHTETTQCGDLFDTAHTLEDYLHFVKCVHVLLHRNPVMMGIRVEQAEVSWLKFLEMGWQVNGDWGTAQGDGVATLWNRWTGHEFVAHTKHAELLLTPADANCKTRFVRPDLLLPSPAATFAEESARFGHGHLASCFPDCPPLVDGGLATHIPDALPHCKVRDAKMLDSCMHAIH